MTRSSTLNRTALVATALAAVTGALLAATPAMAQGGKEYFVQDYKVATPMHGYSGQAGSYYCDYQRLPDRKCTISANGKESCKIVGWTLRQHCY